MPRPAEYTDIFKPEDISIAHIWTLYAGHVMPLGASNAQREDMRRSFYAGFCECFKIISDISYRLGEDRAAKVLSALNNEAQGFFDEMMKRYGVKP